MDCPRCGSKKIAMNGSIHNGKQKYRCKKCNRQFVENPQNVPISKEKIHYIDKLLLEKIPLAGIVRAVGVSERWLQNYVNNKYDLIPKQVNVKEKKQGRLTIQIDEMWSFVVSKKNKKWIWLAIDIETGEVVGVYVGSRDKKGAQGLWDSLPAVYRQCAVFATLIFGRPIKRFCRPKDTVPLAKRAAKQTA